MDSDTKAQFGDPNFDVKAWLNAQMKQPLPEEGVSSGSPPPPASQVPVGKYEKRAQKLSQVLQAESTAVANSLDSAISQALTRLPRSEKEIEKMVNETSSLSTQLEAIGEKSCSTKTPHEHTQQLQKLHHINAKLRRCSDALATASEIAAQVDRIEHSIGQGFDGGMDADTLAVEISKVDKSLAALQKIDPSFGHKLRTKIDSFGTQLEQSLESACLDALRRQDKVKAPTLLATLQTINKDGPVLDQYIEGLVEGKRNSFLKDLEAASQSSVKSTLASFHRSNAKFLKHEHDYHLAIVGGAGSAEQAEQAVRGLQLKYLTRLYSAVSARIEAKLAKSEDNDVIVSSFEATGLVAATTSGAAVEVQPTTSSTTSSTATNAKQSGIEAFLEYPEVLEEVSKPFRHLVDKPFTQKEESKLRLLVDAAIRVIQQTNSAADRGVAAAPSSNTEAEEAEIEKCVAAVLEQVEGWASRAFRYLPDKSVGPAVRAWNSELQRLGTTLLEKVALLGAGVTSVVAADLGENEAFRRILSLHTSCITTEKLFSECEERLGESASQARYQGPHSSGGAWLSVALQSVSVLTEKSGQRLRQILTAPLEGTIQEYVSLPCWSGQGGATASGYQAKPSGPCDTLREAGESFMELLYQLGQTNMEETQKEKLIAMTGAGFTAHYVSKVKEIVFTQKDSSPGGAEGEASSTASVAPVKKEGSFAQLQLVDDVEYLSKVLNTVISDDELRGSCVAQIDELLKN